MAVTPPRWGKANYLGRESQVVTSSEREACPGGGRASLGDKGVRKDGA